MLLLFSQAPRFYAFSIKRIRPRTFALTTTRLFSSPKHQEVPVEISPSDHGTTRLKSLTKGLDNRLVKALEAENLVTPTPIQSHAMPLLKRGYDVMASAQTGTGKTLMFSIPLCQRLLESPKHQTDAPAAIILNPTRELAMQTAAAIRTLLANTSLQVTLATGGANVGQQRRQLKHCDILVGTPGRIMQFVDERILSLHSTTEVVVDEADRMLDYGFEPQLKRIARALGRYQKGERHTILCSATFPPDVQRVASEFLKQDYYFVAAGRVGATHDGIEQKLLWVDGGAPERRKLALQEVRSFLKSTETKGQRVIVFCNTKDEAERLGSALKGSSVRVVTGDKTQSERNKSLEAFRSGKIQVLVASDVASRGLDVPDVGLVVQAESPRDVDTFVHRVGRTGRAGAKGRATALLDGRSVGIAPELVELMHEVNQTVPAWLMGMSHVARSRSIEEEGAIAAGGGSALDDAISSESEHNEKFSAQDFRSSAHVGSWGSERDTSYRSFDEEAYSSLDVSAASSASDALSNETDSSEQDVFHRESVVEESLADSLDDNIVRSTTGDESAHELKEQRSGAMDTSNAAVSPITVEKPSKELYAAFQRITGTNKVGQKPRRDVLTALSRRGGDQRLRFEYIGMFSFDAVSDLLASSGNRRSGSDSNRSGGMPRVLMVAEKPSIAKAIADALSGPRGARQRRGISRALPVYEFTSDKFKPCQSDDAANGSNRCLITVTSVIGHVFSLGFVEESNGGGNRTFNDPSEYFHIPVVKQEEGSTGKLRVVDHLRALAADCDHLVLWLDCDAEGENIAHEVIGVTRRALEKKITAGQSNNAGAPPVRRVHRARFSAITKDALRDAFRELIEPDAALSRSVDARQELDLRVGVAMTRLLTWRCVGVARRKFSPSTKLVSYGPCQTPTLSFCVDRAREIEAFKPKDYWKVLVTAESPGNMERALALRWKPPAKSAVEKSVSRQITRTDDATSKLVEESATFDQLAAKQVVKLASAPNSFASIMHVDHVTEQMKPPLGLNTVGLLAAGSKAMGMSPKQVMNVAEKLYSGGFISYPRTETTRYDPKGFDVREILREHSSHPEWGRTASHLLRTKYAKSGRPPLRGSDAGDHPPITCLKAATRDEVGGGAAWRVYEFVARNFLGSLSDELSYTRSVAELAIYSGKGRRPTSSSDNEPRFELEQVTVNSVGFAGACRWVLRDIGASDKDSSFALQKGAILSITDARLEQCATRPPRFLQEHELIELMDKNRIGTDASMAIHVTNICDRGYVALCDETGTPIRPPRPPRPGQPRLPRQIGRYLVPTPLGINLIDLFGDVTEESSGIVKDVGISHEGSPALLSRPAIRAQMEAEVKQIAQGKLDKAECVDKNLAWFEARYRQLESSLSRQRISEFARDLCPTKESLRYWRSLGAFEPLPPSQQKHQSSGKKKGRQKPQKWTKGRRQRTSAKSQGTRHSSHNRKQKQRS